jgi:hypothetical protein
MSSQPETSSLYALVPSEQVQVRPAVLFAAPVMSPQAAPPAPVCVHGKYVHALMSSQPKVSSL